MLITGLTTFEADRKRYAEEQLNHKELIISAHDADHTAVEKIVRAKLNETKSNNDGFDLDAPYILLRFFDDNGNFERSSDEPFAIGVVSFLGGTLKDTVDQINETINPLFDMHRGGYILGSYEFHLEDRVIDYPNIDFGFDVLADLIKSELQQTEELSLYFVTSSPKADGIEFVQ